MTERTTDSAGATVSDTETELLGRVAAATMDICAESGWSSVRLLDVAARAGLRRDDMLLRFPGKPMLVGAVAAHADRLMLADIDPDSDEETPRERLFGLLMARFDAMDPYKAGLSRLMRDLPSDPASGLLLGPRLALSMTLTLEAAGIAAHGLLGLGRVAALSALYAGVVRTWLKDDTEDAARTMAALDKALARAEELANSVPACKRRGKRDNENVQAKTRREGETPDG